MRACAIAILLSAAEVSAQHRPVRHAAQWRRMLATAYCAKGITDSGARTRRGIVAADPRVIPIGSTIRVRGLRGAPDGLYSVLDTGRKVTHRRIDVLMPSCARAKRFGRQAVLVKVTGAVTDGGATKTRRVGM